MTKDAAQRSMRTFYEAVKYYHRIHCNVVVRQEIPLQAARDKNIPCDIDEYGQIL
jgi:hypothetical protein